MTMAHRTITFTFKTGAPGPLPLAVLRPLRRRLHLRLRRPDADDRLHGRVPQCQLTRRAAARRRARRRLRPPLPDPLDRRERHPDADRRDLPRARRSRPGTASVQASGQVLDNTVLVSVLTPVAALRAALRRLRAHPLPRRRRRGRRAARPRRTAGSRIVWAVVTTVVVALARHVRLLRARPGRRRRRPGALGRVRAGRKLARRWTSR